MQWTGKNAPKYWIVLSTSTLGSFFFFTCHYLNKNMTVVQICNCNQWNSSYSISIWRFISILRILNRQSWVLCYFPNCEIWGLDPLLEVVETLVWVMHGLWLKDGVWFWRIKTSWHGYRLWSNGWVLGLLTCTWSQSILKQFGFTSFFGYEVLTDPDHFSINLVCVRYRSEFLTFFSLCKMKSPWCEYADWWLQEWFWSMLFTWPWHGFLAFPLCVCMIPSALYMSWLVLIMHSLYVFGIHKALCWRCFGLKPIA